MMFCDLNLSFGSGAKVKRKDVLETVKRLGYRKVAVNVFVGDQIREDLRPEWGKGGKDGEGEEMEERGGILCPRGVRSRRGRGVVEVLSRVTVAVQNVTQLAAMKAMEEVLCRFDLVAVAPSTEKMLQMCLELDVVDIIAIDITSSARLSVPLRPATIAKMKKKGIVAEICYAGAVRDTTMRRFVVTNAAAIVRATGGVGIIISSGAQNIMVCVRIPQQLNGLHTHLIRENGSLFSSTKLFACL